MIISSQSLYWRGETLYALFRIPGERVPVRRSMGTCVIAKAKQKAYHEFVNLQAQLRSGKPRRQVKFRTIAELVRKRLEDELSKRREFGEFEPGGARLRHPETLGKKIKQIAYLIEHFGDQPISDITDDDIKAFKVFIATYWTKGPGVNITEFKVIKRGKPLTVTRRELGIASRVTHKHQVRVTDAAGSVQDLLLADPQCHLLKAQARVRCPCRSL